MQLLKVIVIYIIFDGLLLLLQGDCVKTVLLYNAWMVIQTNEVAYCCNNLNSRPNWWIRLDKNVKLAIAEYKGSV